MPSYAYLISAYLLVISVVAVAVTCYDKRAAIKHLRRVPEARLLLISALGGSAAMLITMLIIRHKTLHLKFMLGIPLIIALQLAAAVLAAVYL